MTYGRISTWCWYLIRNWRFVFGQEGCIYDIRTNNLDLDCSKVVVVSSSPTQRRFAGNLLIVRVSLHVVSLHNVGHACISKKSSVNTIRPSCFVYYCQWIHLSSWTVLTYILIEQSEGHCHDCRPDRIVRNLETRVLWLIPEGGNGFRLELVSGIGYFSHL